MEFVWIEGKAPGFEKAKQVREAVFVEEQGYSWDAEFDETDSVSHHLLGMVAQTPLSTARLFKDKDGAYHIGRVAVLASCRGQGAGAQMLELLVQKARQLQAGRIVLSAQADKTGFYEKAGFVSTGVLSEDEGQPHVEMQLDL